jgi:hypothetical protein
LKVFQKIFGRPGVAWLDQTTVATQIAIFLKRENVIQHLMQEGATTTATLRLNGATPTLTSAIAAVAQFFQQLRNLAKGFTLFGSELHTNALDNFHNLSSF